jgi:hypothetical protein
MTHTQLTTLIDVQSYTQWREPEFAFDKHKNVIFQPFWSRSLPRALTCQSINCWAPICIHGFALCTSFNCFFHCCCCCCIQCVPPLSRHIGRWRIFFSFISFLRSAPKNIEKARKAKEGNEEREKNVSLRVSDFFSFPFFTERIVTKDGER